MFHDAKVKDGVLYFKSTPNGEWIESTSSAAIIIKQLWLLSDREREEIFGYFCTSCGSDNPQCQCWNDD